MTTATPSRSVKVVLDVTIWDADATDPDAVGQSIFDHIHATSDLMPEGNWSLDGVDVEVG